MNIIHAARTGGLLALALVVGVLAGCGQTPAPPAAAHSGSPHAPSPAPARTPPASPSAATVTGPPGGPVPAGFEPQSVTFVSASEGWVLGTAPCAAQPCTSVVRTLDGGRTWQGIPAPVAALSNLGQGHGVGALRFADSLDGFAYRPDLYVTHNGGSTWNQVRLPGTIGDLEAAHGVVYAAVRGSGGRERIYRTPAGSNQWSRVAGQAPSGGIGGALAQPRPAHVFIATNSGATWIYASSNGGQTWQTVLTLPDGGAGLSDFGFTTATQAVAVEGRPDIGSHLYMTRDSGRSWSRARF